MKPDTLLDQLKQGILTKCKHFNGTKHGSCAAGIPYASVEEKPSPGKPLRLPCFTLGTFAGPDLPCEKRYIPSETEAEAEARETSDRLYANAAAIKVAKDDARAKGLKRGSGGYGSVTCTRCGGTLRYSVAALNGHMHGHCSTKGCVSWME